MKKAIVLSIAILFVGSIALIGVLGGKLINPPDKVITKVTEINFDLAEMAKQEGITITDIRYNDLGETVVDIKRDRITSFVQIKFKVLPDDASNKSLSVIVSSMPDTASIDGDSNSETFGKMTFTHELNTMSRSILIFKTNDGTNKTKTMIIRVT